MRRLAILAAICLALVSAGLAALGPDFTDLPFIDIYMVPDSAIVPGHVWIRLSPELSGQLQRLEHENGDLASFGIAELDELNRQFEVSRISQLFYSPGHRSEFAQRHQEWGLHLWYEISFASKADIREIVMAYRGLKGSVEWAEPEYRKVLYEAVAGQNPEPTETLDRWTPNDPYYSSQWHYNNTGQSPGGTVDCDIDLPEAWDLEKGHQDVIVAVIDGGIQTTHPDLNNNIWSGVGYNFVNNNSTINPEDHGTHVAGTIAAENNNSTGVSGIAGGNGTTKGVSLMSCQVFDGNDQGGFDDAPVWAADNGAAISQNSWGYQYPDVYNQSELTAINYFNANGGGSVLDGGITIFAAGNDEAEGNFYPGCYSGAFSVAATNNQDEKSYYSNWGTWVDISAPGGELIYYYTTGIRSTVTGNGYDWYQGTSMACPHVSGAAASIISYAHRNGITLTSTQLKTILQSTADDHYPENPGYTGKLGAGRLNLYNALLAVQPPLNPPLNLAATATHASVTLTWDAPEAATPNNYKLYRNSSYLATTANLTYTDLPLTDGVTYSYHVVASYTDGDSEPSNTVTATPNTWPPTNLTAVGGDTVVHLNWIAAQGRGEKTAGLLEERNISGYRIYRDGSLLTTVTGLTYTDNAVVNETTYSYYLIAVYSGGVSDPTDTVQATPSAIVPTEVIIGTGTTSNGTTTACPVNQYYRSLHGQSVYTAGELNAAGVIGPINITQIGFNITGLPAQAMPNFVVRMGHTSASNVASWISTSLTQVWSSASYQPTATGWNMYTLSTPFLWNGTDNIVVDTAFGLIGSWNSSGTTQYTEVTNGYRYGRSDDDDQTNVFTGGSTSTNRPNLKLALLPNEEGPMIVVNPTTLAYGDVAVGGTDVKTFTIANGGDQTLSGTITTPAGYSVVDAARSTEALLTGKETRNSLGFSVNAGASKTYNLTFAPSAAQAYNGNVVIANNSSNNTSVNVAVTGTGYIPATIDIDNDALYANLQVETEGTDSFTITNTGSQPLIYSISMEELLARANRQPQAASDADKSIAGSTLTLDATDYLPGTTVDWTFTATNASTDTEWINDVIISFPAGVTVNSATNFVGGDGGELTPDVTSGSGVTVTWHGEGSSGWGLIYGNGDSATATVNVTIGAGFGGDLTLPWTLNGDVYGADPHTLDGSIVLTEDVPPISWLSVQPLSGSIPAGQSATITAYFSAVGMAVGSYEAMLTIYSNDPVNPSLDVSATMDVWDNGNHAPQIDLPASFAFDRNGSLAADFSSYVSDEELDPLTLGYSGNTNVFVAINGLSVTFTAAQNWTGTETVTFSVYDGYTYAYDSVQVTVNEVAGPGWEAVLYPNSATLHGIVTIYGVAGELNDVVGAFVGTECRGVADVVMNGANAYVTIVVNLASDGEEISFKIYDYSANLAYDALETYSLGYNDVIGSTETPVPVSVSEITELDTPVITAIAKVSGGFRIAWSEVDNADIYEVWRATDPYGTYEQVGFNVNALLFDDLTELPMAFYYIKAVKN
jgi:subtilisin family serine protease